MREAARNGGSRKALPLPISQTLTSQDARGLLASVLAALLEGSLDAVTARAVAYVLQVERRIAEGSEQERRITALEALLAQRRG
ncbi:MAG: hypothetical protein ACE5Q6_15850 [Dehalococcoidia bacterium]